MYSRPLRFVSDFVFDDPWSHLLMSTLAPRGYVKVLIRILGCTSHSQARTTEFVSSCVLSKYSVFLCFRCHPSECRACCCSSSPNCSTSPSSETSRLHTHAQAFLVTGWEIHTHVHNNNYRLKIRCKIRIKNFPFFVKTFCLHLKCAKTLCVVLTTETEVQSVSCTVWCHFIHIYTLWHTRMTSW